VGRDLAGGVVTGVHDGDAPAGGGGPVDGVDPEPEPADHREPGVPVEHRGVDRRPHDEQSLDRGRVRRSAAGPVQFAQVQPRTGQQIPLRRTVGKVGVEKGDRAHRPIMPRTPRWFHQSKDVSAK
jgi:hypothetical protein